jgi:arabinosaccharide transport system substrate-binding protein
MSFPFGKAPFFIFLTAVITGAGVFLTHNRYGDERPDLILTTHARLHADIYRARIPEFERLHNVRVEIQEIEQNAFRTRMQAAFDLGLEVPDLVEIPQGPAAFIRGPIDKIGFLDITDWVRENRFEERMVASRFALWQSRGVTFGMPHDVHPVMLAYRADIIEDELGIDVSLIETWDDFVAMAREVTADLNGNGTIDRYALELPSDGGDMLNLLLLQRGISLFDEHGNVAFDSDEAADVVIWYLTQVHGPHRIGYHLGWGQPQWRGMMDGVVLFYFTPDWRTRTIEQYAPAVAGKMKLMPLPAWEPGGRRTSTWGSTGAAIPKNSRNPELAKKLLEFLYVDTSDGGQSWADLRILPPAREAWDLPIFSEPNPFWRNQPILKKFAALAGDVPPDYITPFSPKAEGKRNEAFLNCAAYYRANGERGLREFVRAELRRSADQVREVAARNVLLDP